VPKRKPFAVYPIVDFGRTVALVRYDGDPDVFAALAADWLRYAGHERPVEPPQPRLYRMNACQSDEFAWQLGKPTKRGPGVFLGALVTLSRPREPLGEMAPHGCWRCDAEWGERHLARCGNNRPVAALIGAGR
jgi:hypothetical protein